jgi:hypothetical protein
MAFDFKKKKGSEEMNPMEQESKMSVLGGLKQDAESDMLSKLQGLKAGAADGSIVHEGAEAVQEEQAEVANPLDSMTEGLSSEELQALIDKLLEKKDLLEGKSVFKPEIQ